MVQNYSDFCEELLAAGFSMAGGNAKGIYAVVPFDWKANDVFDTPVRWHTGEPETDPWEWRMRVLEERDDIAYAKVFPIRSVTSLAPIAKINCMISKKRLVPKITKHFSVSFQFSLNI